MADKHESVREDRFGDAAGGWFRGFAFPLFLLIVCPPIAIFLWMTAVHFDGSLVALLQADIQQIADLWPMPTFTSVAILTTWVAMQAILLVALPAKTHLGPLTPRGNRPSYKLNGLLAYFVTHALLAIASYGLGWFSPTIVYDHFGELLATCSAFALVLCLFLYFKGRYFPSTDDASVTGNFVWDYFWGTELHPRIGSIELKQLINCRVAMMGWSVILLSFAAKQAELHGLGWAMTVCVGLQVVYIIKFFHWESGYFSTLDIMHDRFGWYICWGVLAWLPVLYTIPGLYLVDHPGTMGPARALGLAAMGALALWLNYEADEQRQRVRATGGKTKVWGKDPELLHAKYQTLDGKTHENLLLVSGWWGVSRHFHYLPEILLALSWTLPSGFSHILPYFYVMFLTILLVDRARRDELRCSGKYGETWKEYCRRVPYRIIPYVY